MRASRRCATLTPSRRNAISPDAPGTARLVALLALVVTLVVAGMPGCGDGGEPLVVDLTRSRSCFVADREELSPRTSGALRVLRQPDARAVDCYLRLPASRSRLVFRLPPEVDPSAVGVAVASDERQATPELVRGERGAWLARLSGFDGEVVRLRLENRSGRALDWIQPRVEGSDRVVPPPLPAPTAPREDPPNVIVYVVDALRADRLSVYGHTLPTSPRLEELLAAGATLFEAAYAAGPNTRNSIPPLFASLPAAEVQGQLRSRKAIRHVLAESLQSAGFRTAAFQANFWLRRPAGFDRGFDVYEVLGGSEQGIASGAELLASAVAWLRETRQPFFLYVQTMDVHDPYEPPAPFAGRFGETPISPAPTPPDLGIFEVRERARALYARTVPELKPHFYDDAVAYADHQLGRLLDAVDELGLRDSTIVVVTADHGESLGEGNRWLHGLSLHEEQVRVPLVVALPWRKQPVRVEEVVSLVDLAPSLLALTGVPVPAQFRGRDLTRSRAAAEPSAAVGSLGTSGWFVREGEWKLVATRSQARLYHLPSDPEEAVDRSAAFPVRTGFLRSLLWAHSLAFREGSYEPLPLDSGLSDPEREQLEDDLRALGYAE